MPDNEIQLEGGNTSGEVVRVGSTVRKNMTKHSPTTRMYTYLGVVAPHDANIGVLKARQHLLVGHQGKPEVPAVQLLRPAEQ